MVVNRLVNVSLFTLFQWPILDYTVNVLKIKANKIISIFQGFRLLQTENRL